MNTNAPKVRTFSGIQATGLMHVGNYLGAVTQWLKWQNDYEAIFGIMDLHALTVPRDPAVLKNDTFKTAAALLALGLNPNECSIIVQSHVPQHSELMWLLSTVTPFSRLKEMTQFKEKSKKQGQDVNTGLFMYPVLMAADILLYDPQEIPVGQDQVQHVELARLIARKFNNRFGKVFTEPQPRLVKTTARVMSLTDPSKKMSKSDLPKTYLGIFESPEVIVKKLKGAVTDSGAKVAYDPKKKPALANLINIGAALKGLAPLKYAVKFKNARYATFKEALAQDYIEFFAPARERYELFLENPDSVLLALEQGADRAKEMAEIKMAQVRKAIGLLG